MTGNGHLIVCVCVCSCVCVFHVFLYCTLFTVLELHVVPAGLCTHLDQVQRQDSTWQQQRGWGGVCLSASLCLSLSLSAPPPLHSVPMYFKCRSSLGGIKVSGGSNTHRFFSFMFIWLTVSKWLSVEGESPGGSFHSETVTTR